MKTDPSDTAALEAMRRKLLEQAEKIDRKKQEPTSLHRG